MSTVKSNKFSPQSLPIVQIDGFNDVESYIVGSGQTSFTSTKFTHRSPVRAFTRNGGDPSLWDELTVNWSDSTTFTIVQSFSENDEILLFGVNGYYQGEDSVLSDDVLNTSTNSEFDQPTLTEVIDLLGSGAKEESYKQYGIGSSNLQQVNLFQSENIPTGFYTLIDVGGYAGSLINMTDTSGTKQLYIPFVGNQIQSRNNEGGSFGEFSPSGDVSVLPKTTAFTISQSELSKHVRVTNANAVNVTVPSDTTDDLLIGSNVAIIQSGAGAVTFVPDTGVTINSADSLLSTRVQFSSASLVKVSVDEWDLIGDLV